ncbi:metallophosphoesterase family protein [Botrimarina sp.]|uniref:metallophosphoesterase family protein n=1 Tax=Botrimarina sp. TaxID=2795802 RepID=UPI0032EE2361
MTRLVHVSDLHLGPYFLPEVADRLLDAVAGADPDAIVASGDFTQRATSEEFADARRYLDKFPRAPLVVTPGNHDVPLYRVLERLFQPHRNYRRAIADELDYALSIDGATIVSIDSTAPRRAIVNGRISRWQLDRCDEWLAAAPGEHVRIVVAHHHFAPAPDYEGSDTLPGAKRALDRFAASGVELILGGHLHRAYVGNSLDVYPGVRRDRGIVIAQSGTSTSRRGRAREREKNSFNVVDLCDETITITHWMHLESQSRFAPMSRHTFPRVGQSSLSPLSLSDADHTDSGGRYPEDEAATL